MAFVRAPGLIIVAASRSGGPRIARRKQSRSVDRFQRTGSETSVWFERLRIPLMLQQLLIRRRSDSR